MAGGKRWAYLNEYQKDASGTYVYTGAYYGIADDAARKHTYARLIGCLSLLTAGVVGSGCFNAAGAGSSFYVILPYIAEVACLFFLLWNCVRLLLAGRRVKAYIYQSVSKYIPPASLLLTFFAAAGCACAVVFVILNGFAGGIALCICYFALKLCNAALAVLIRRIWASAGFTRL